jgi:DnaJ-class molecular chaperone
MSDTCKHHWHVCWFDKFQEVIQCCHCGETLDEGEYTHRSRDEGCGNKISSRVSFTPPCDGYVVEVMGVCEECEGEGAIQVSELGSWVTCRGCGGEGRVMSKREEEPIVPMGRGATTQDLIRMRQALEERARKTYEVIDLKKAADAVAKATQDMQKTEND